MRISLWCAMAVAVVFGWSVSSAFAGVEVSAIRYWSAPEHTRIVLDLSQPPYYDMFELREPARLVIDLKDASVRMEEKEVVIDDHVVSKVRWGFFKPGLLRVVIDLVQSAETKIFILKRFQDKPDRLVVDFFRADLEKQEEEKRSTVRQTLPGTRVVVIDPGHGGEDPGAIGPSGVMEKTVVLAIAKKICDSLNGTSGFKAFLTREKDYFIPLRKRWRIAKQYNADFFISIHANASFNRKKRGAEVYCLSLSGASQEAARILADQENSSDLIGGVDLDSCPTEVDSILVEMVQTRTINDGLLLGNALLQELKKTNGVNFPEPLQAGFAVLKAPDIPSILIEAGYLSNHQEEKLLSSASFQTNSAAAIKRGIERFLHKAGAEAAQGPASLSQPMHSIASESAPTGGK
jgi:N-acetylmuramoyl-L-alanine amidase